MALARLCVAANCILQLAVIAHVVCLAAEFLARQVHGLSEELRSINGVEQNRYGAMSGQVQLCEGKSVHLGIAAEIDVQLGRWTTETVCVRAWSRFGLIQSGKRTDSRPFGLMVSLCSDVGLPWHLVAFLFLPASVLYYFTTS